jgi:hypothetical protein
MRPVKPRKLEVLDHGTHQRWLYLVEAVAVWAGLYRPKSRRARAFCDAARVASPLLAPLVVRS